MRLEVRAGRTVRYQKTDCKQQRTEYRSQKTEDRGRKGKEREKRKELWAKDEG